MQHYIALIWNPTDRNGGRTASQFAAQRTAETQCWRVQVNSPGMAIFTRQIDGAGADCVILPNGVGAILGHVFHSNDCARIFEFETHAEKEILRTCGRYLVDHYWGAYIAILHDHVAMRSFVIRDCSGKLPCFRMKIGEINLLFSSIRDALSLDLPRLYLNREYLAAFVFFPDIQTRHCGLKDVQEVLAGECILFSGDTVTQFPIWDPGDVAENDQVIDYDSAVIQLKETTESCIRAWASVHHNILLSLSGGLDSSIVLGCLKQVQAHSRVSCYNVFSRNPNEDERRFARLAANRAGVQLVEIDRDALGIRWDSNLFEAPVTPKPQIQTLAVLPELDRINQIAGNFVADAIWTGQGGDHLFWQDGSSLGASDYLLLHGIRPGLLRAVANSALLSRSSYLSVLRTMWRSWRPKNSFAFQRIANLDSRFVNPLALPDNLMEYTLPPWTSAVARLPPGKQSQIFHLGDVLNRHRPFPGLERAYQHHPLLSQPLIELCLRIPTYLLLYAGQSRGLARNAFRNHIPPEIHARQDKGSIGVTVMDLIHNSAAFIRDILMDGILVQERVIDRQLVDRWIVNREPIRAHEIRPLVACITAEIWARSWTTGNARARQ